MLRPQSILADRHGAPVEALGVVIFALVAINLRQAIQVRRDRQIIGISHLLQDRQGVFIGLFGVGGFFLGAVKIGELRIAFGDYQIIGAQRPFPNLKRAQVDGLGGFVLSLFFVNVAQLKERLNKVLVIAAPGIRQFKGRKQIFFRFAKVA